MNLQITYSTFKTTVDEIVTGGLKRTQIQNGEMDWLPSDEAETIATFIANDLKKAITNHLNTTD